MTQKSNKSAIMWNMQQPDDPYDIKKSMIAKLPDHPSKPMGQYLEVVCLLQSAQIERLSDFLTQMKAKYRQIQRRQLDRHSYQVQIKQLAEKTYAYNTVKTQNDRLKDFIRRQTFQLEELQKTKINAMSLEVLQAKYEGVLNELKISRQQKQRLQISISKLNYEVTEWKGKWERAELEKSSQRSQFEVQLRERIAYELKITNDKANQRNQKLMMEIRQLKEYIQNKNLEIASLMSQREQFTRQIRLLQDKNKSRGNIQQSLNQKNREIQRLNIQLSQKNAKLEQAMSSMQKLGGQNRILQERYYILQKQNQTLLIKIRQNEQSSKNKEDFDRYEDKIAMMSMEIERLNALNSSKGRDIIQLNGEIQQYRLQLQRVNSLRQQLERQRDRLKSLEGQTQIKAAQESRITLLTQELQRVAIQIRLKNEELTTLNQRFRNAQMNSNQMVNQNIRLKQQLQASRTQLWNYKNITQNEIKSLRNDYSKVMQDMQIMEGRHSESEKYRLQCDRLRVELDRIRNESIIIKRGADQQRINHSRFISQRNFLAETNNKLTQDNIRLTQQNKRLVQELRAIQVFQANKQKEQLHLVLKRQEQKEDTIRALHEQLESRRDRNEQLQTTVQKIYGQIDRLHALLSSKTNQHLRLSKQYAQLQEKYRFLEAKLNNAVGEKEYYENQFMKFKSQIDNMSRFTGDAQRQIENKARQFAIQKQRYQRVIVQNQKLIAEYKREKQELQRRLIDMQRELALRVSHQQQINEQLKREQLQIRQELRYKQTLILQLQTTIKEKQIYFRQGQDRSKQFQSRIIEWESRLKQAERGIYMRDQQKQQLLQTNKRIAQERQRLGQDLNRLGQDLKRANDQITRLNMQLGRINQQNSSIKIQISKITQENSSYKIEISKKTQQLNRQADAINRSRKDEENKLRQKLDSLNQENLRFRMRIDQLTSQQKSRVNEEQLRMSIMRAEQALKNEKIQVQNSRMTVRRLEQLINRQKIEIESLKQSAKEYQLKIVHIEAANSKHFQERLKQEEFRLQDQLRQSQAYLHQKQNLIVNMQRQINQLQRELKSLMEKYRSAQKNLDQYQQKIALVSSENQRLQTLIRQKIAIQRQKNIMIEKLELQMRDVGQSRHTDYSQSYKIQITNLKTAIQELENINLHTIAQRDQLFKICHQLKAEKEFQMAKTTEEERRIKNQLQYRGEESRRFGEQIGLLRKKEQSYLSKIRQLEELLSRPQEDQASKRRIMQLQHIVSTQTRQIQELRIQNTNLHTEIRQIEVIIHEERDRIVNTNQDEVMVLNNKINEQVVLMKVKDEEVRMWQSKYTGLYTAYQQLYINYNLTKGQYQLTLSKIKEYEQKIFKLEQDFNEVNRLVIQNRELKIKLQNNGELYQKNLLLSKEIDRLTQINKMMKIELQEIRLRLADNVSLSKRIQEHLALFVVLFAQIQALRSRLANSEHECEQVRRSSLAPLRVDKSERRN